MARVAVLIPVYNDEAGLLATLASLREEPEAHDVVVVDDGSSPPIAPSLSVTRLIRLDNNLGIAAALNAGLEWILGAGYPFVARIDASDIHCPARLREQAARLNQDSFCVAVGGQAVFIDSDGSDAFAWNVPLRDADLRRHLHIRNCMIHPALMLRTEALRQTGLYALDYPGAEDYELMLRMIGVGTICNVENVVVRTRLNPKGISSARRRQQLNTVMRLQLHHFDWSLPEAYVGIAWSALRWITPYGAAARIKGFIRR